VVQYLSGRARLLLKEPDQYVLGADVWVAEAGSGRVCQLKGTLCAIRVGPLSHGWILQQQWCGFAAA
jgi:hypothetical protein